MSRLATVAFSVLDLAFVREGGDYAESLTNTVDLARHAESLGFTRFWLAEHHSMDAIASSATAVLIGHVAAATSRIRVGSGGIMLPNHRPLVIAEQFGTLATLYPGRIDLGLGRAPGGDRWVMRALGSDRPGAGEDFPEQVAELRFLLGPKQPGQRVVAVPGWGTEVPIWLLGSSLFSAQLAAALGLPYAFASHFAPRYLLQALHVYRQNFQPSEVVARPHVGIGVPLTAAPTDEEADYLATTRYQRLARRARGEMPRQPPPVRSMEGLWTQAEQQFAAEFLALAAIGGPETVRDRLEAILQATEADEIFFVGDFYDHADHKRSLDIVAKLKVEAAAGKVAAE